MGSRVALLSWARFSDTTCGLCCLIHPVWAVWDLGLPKLWLQSP